MTIDRRRPAVRAAAGTSTTLLVARATPGRPLESARSTPSRRLRPRPRRGVRRAPGSSSPPRPRCASPATTSPSTSGRTRSSWCATTTRWCGRCTTCAATAARGSSPSRCGSVGNIVCGYHRWTYATDGSPAARRRPAAGLRQEPASASSTVARPRRRRAGLRLPGRRAARRLRRRGRQRVTPYLAAAPARTAPRSPPRSTWSRRPTGSWCMENNRECYHCEGGHPELICTFFPTYGYADGPDPGPAAARPRALPARPRRRSQARLRRARGLPYARGRGARRPGLGVPGPARGARRRRRVLHHRRHGPRRAGCSATSTRPRLGRVLAAHPAQRLVPRPRRPRGDLLRCCRSSVDRTLVRTTWLVHEDAVEGVDYDVDTLTHVWRETNEQDAVFCARAQRGVASPGLRAGPVRPAASTRSTPSSPGTSTG